MAIISTRAHGVLDYLSGAALIAAPFLLGFANGGPAQWVPIIIGVLTILSSLATKYELGAVHLIPFRVHLVLDVLMGVVLLASPLVFGFTDQIWWPHVLFGVIYILVPALTRKVEPDGAYS